MKSRNAIENVMGLHQYYRDCLSQPVDFPDIGQLSPELIEWVTDCRNTDVTQLVEYLEELPGSGLPADEDRALRLMLFTILQANLASDCNNRFPDYTLPPSIVANIQRSLGRVLELHPAYGHIAICVQLLYRIKQVEDVIALSETYPVIFAQYPVLQAIAGFIHTMLGNYEDGLRYLKPLEDDPVNRQLPLVSLAAMTCEAFLGKVPTAPVSFASINADTADIPRLLATLPPLELIQPLASTPRPVVFVACDTAYFFAHAVYLAYSVHETNAGMLDLHMHLYSPDQSVLAEIDLLRARLPGLSIGVSVEYGKVPLASRRSYYATARFARAYQILREYQCELCLIDADAIFNKGWHTFKARLDAQTELALTRTGSAPFWERVAGGFIYCQPTSLAEQFLGKVAHFILHNIELRSVVWFTDQIALSAADHYFLAGNPAVHYADARQVIDIQFADDALCWAVTTRKTGNPKYDAALERLKRRYT